MMIRNAVDGPAMNSRMATTQMTGMRIPPRVRTIPSVRRRLPVTVVSDPSVPVIIRHVVQKMDTPITEAHPVQNQRV